MADLKPEDLVKLREIATSAARPVETAGGAMQRDRDLVLLASTFTPEVCLSLLADRARMEKAIELLCEVYEAARDVSMAAVQDDDGEWSIKGDPEAMLGRLYLATEEVRKVTKGASSELRGRDVTVARRYTDDDYQEMRRNLYPTKGASQ